MSKKTKLGATVFRDFVEFGLWAPDAISVDLILGDEDFREKTFGMEKRDDDIFFAKIPEAKVGMTYYFSANYSGENGETFAKIFNDPRARQLTSSTKGKSVIAEPEFDWGNDVGFAPEIPEKQIIYELHVGTFNQPDNATAGTFATVREKFDYLKNLGVNMLEIMPINSMLDGIGWGYAPINQFAVEENYGGPHAFREFVREAHKSGFGIIVDVVFNHMYPETDLPDAYFFAKNPENSAEKNFRDTPWGPRFDYANPKVRDYLEDCVAMWLEEYHADGLRMDFTLGIRQRDFSRDSLDNVVPGGWETLQKLTETAKKIKPRARIIAEDNGANNFLTLPILDGGAGFDAQWNVEFPRVFREKIGGGNLDGLISEFSRNYNGDFREKIVFTESHDTAAVSNGGGRLAKVFDNKNPDSRDSRMTSILAGALTFAAPGTPMIFEGQEFGAANGWSALDPLNWDFNSGEIGVKSAFEHLINLRKNVYDDSAGLTENGFREIWRDDAAGIYAFLRGENEQKVLVVANFSRKNLENYKITNLDGTWRVRFNSSWIGYGEDFANSKIQYLMKETALNLPGRAVIFATGK